MPKKGFVFVETIVVVAILTIALLIVYSSYSSIVINNNTRLKYDDPSLMYRTFYIQKFLKNSRLDLVASNLDLSTNQVMENFNCSNSGLFINSLNDVGICENIISEFHISNMYLTFNDLSFIQECTSNTGKCNILNLIGSEMAAYLKTIGGKGKSGYRLILEFGEQPDGSICIDESKCKYYYANISLGDVL